MAVKVITYNVKTKNVVFTDIDDAELYEGENNATQIVVDFTDADLTGWLKVVNFVAADGTTHTEEFTGSEAEDTVDYLLDSTLLKEGTLQIQPEARLNGDVRLFGQLRLRVSANISSGDNTTFVNIDGIRVIDFDTTNTVVLTTPGQLGWDADNGTFAAHLLDAIQLPIGQEIIYYGKVQGEFSAHDVMQIAGVQGDYLLFKKAVPAEIKANPYLLVGVAITGLLSANFVYITWFGKVENVNSYGWAAGTQLYFNAVVGNLTSVVQEAPNPKIIMGTVIKQATSSSANDGVLMIRTDFGMKMERIQDMKSGSAAGDILRRDPTNLFWQATPLDTAYIGPIGPQGIQGIQGLQGIQGVQGLPGPQGEIGLTGADGEDGRDGAVWSGAFSAVVTYHLDDIVFYEGSSYICVVASTTQTPLTTDWELVAKKGDKGDKGEIGLTGEIGLQGITGLQGIEGPQGIMGLPGEPGAPGAKGETGDTGPMGTGITWRGDWWYNSVYIIGDAVSWYGQSWVCIQGNTSLEPSTSGNTVNFWSVFAAKGDIGAVWEGAFNSERTYYPRDIVYFEGSSYVCLLDDTTLSPTASPSSWALIASGSEDMLVATDTAVATPVNIPAIEISVADTGNYYTGTNMEAVLQEVGLNKATKPSLLGAKTTWADTDLILVEDGTGVKKMTVAYLKSLLDVAIIEKGSNANGLYIRHKGGRIEQFITATITASSGLVAFTYPIAFPTAIQFISAGLRYTSGQLSSQLTTMVVAQPNNLTSGFCYARKPDGSSPTEILTASIHVIGY